MRLSVTLRVIGLFGVGRHNFGGHHIRSFLALRSTSPGATATTLLDRGEVPDLLVSGGNFDLVGGDPHDPTTTSETRSANAISGYRPCWRKISLITKINSYAQSKNEHESEASNLNITRRWSSESQRTTHICTCFGVAKARCKTKLKL
jgi:hypothetical protein